jgi:hypothetical protein
MLLQEAEIERLKRELTAAQARERQVRKMLVRTCDVIASLPDDVLGDRSQMGRDGEMHQWSFRDEILAIAKPFLTWQPDHTALDAALSEARAEERERCKLIVEAQEKDAQANFLDQFGNDADLYKREYWRGVCVGAQCMTSAIREATK